MLYEHLKWVIRSPPEHPICSLSVSVSSSGYKANGLRPPSPYKRRDAELSALADTGCQAVCMGRAQLQSLGLSVKDLLEPVLNLKAANSTGIKVLGAIFLHISGTDRRGIVWETHQICYVAEGLNQMLLSKQACEELGMISPSFPAVGCHSTNNQVTVKVGEIDATELIQSEFDLTPCSPDEEGTYKCPKREPKPPPPEFPSGKTAAELREIIIKHYSSYAFNRFTRQKLPMMKGDPLPIPANAEVRPTVFNKHVPVPRHWEDKVFKDLQRDVALSVIEPVPMNTPVTWCARMIIIPKQSGEPRRTVDLQGLNKASVRQTHPLNSPFKLASDVPAGKIKSVLDVWNSFHSVPVREEDKHKLTFITPWGRFRYLVAPQGYLASGDGYTLRFANITEGIENKISLVDDTHME